MKNTITISLALAILGGVFFGIFSLIQNLINAGHGELLLGLILGLIPSAISLVVHFSDRKQEHKNWLLRDEKAYIPDIIDVFISLIGPEDRSAEDDSAVNKKLLERLKKLRPAILAHGKGNTIREWNKLMTSGLNPDSADDADEVFRRLERLIRALRKDIGHDDSKLNPGEILMMLMNAEEHKRIFKACENETYDDFI